MVLSFIQLLSWGRLKITVSSYFGATFVITHMPVRGTMHTKSVWVRNLLMGQSKNIHLGKTNLFMTYLQKLRIGIDIIRCMFISAIMIRLRSNGHAAKRHSMREIMRPTLRRRCIQRQSWLLSAWIG